MALLQKLILPRWFSARWCSSAALELGAKASFSRRLSQTDVDAFTALSGDSNPVHRGPRAVVHGALLNALVSCAMGTLMPGPGSMVVGQTIKYPQPCHAEEWVTVRRDFYLKLSHEFLSSQDQSRYRLYSILRVQIDYLVETPYYFGNFDSKIDYFSLNKYFPIFINLNVF
jgi:hypothetical protein